MGPFLSEDAKRSVADQWVRHVTANLKQTEPRLSLQVLLPHRAGEGGLLRSDMKRDQAQVHPDCTNQVPLEPRSSSRTILPDATIASLAP